MREKNCTFDYAVIRLVPRVEREEFINVGVILSCPAQKFLKAKIELNEEKLKTFAPQLDPENVRRYLDVVQKICRGDKDAGAIGHLTERERFYWLTAARSTIIQASPVHTGFCTNADETLERLFDKMVR